MWVGRGAREPIVIIVLVGDEMNCALSEQD